MRRAQIILRNGGLRFANPPYGLRNEQTGFMLALITIAMRDTHITYVLK